MEKNGNNAIIDVKVRYRMDDVISIVIVKKIIAAIRQVMKNGWGGVYIEIKDRTITKISVAIDEKLA